MRGERRVDKEKMGREREAEATDGVMRERRGKKR